MQIALHAGAHATDEDRLITCLRKNRVPLARSRVGVPPPSSYRKLLRDIFNTAQDGGLASDSRALVLDAIGETAGLDRLVLSNQGFFGSPKMALSGSSLYPAAEARIDLLQRIFDEDEITLFLGLRNPAMFLPALLGDTPFATVDALLRGGDPAELRWSHLVARIRVAFPHMPVTVWCHEDTPLIWGRILREMAGTQDAVTLDGEFAFVAEIMTPTGFQRLTDHLAAHPELTAAQKQDVLAGFLDQHAIKDCIEVELDVRGWSPGIIDQITDIYDAELDRMRRIDGVHVIAP